jgi:hypothetical protein
MLLTVTQVEEERRSDIHKSNEKRKEFNQRETIVQVRHRLFIRSMLMETFSSNTRKPLLLPNMLCPLPPSPSASMSPKWRISFEHGPRSNA